MPHPERALKCWKRPFPTTTDPKSPLSGGRACAASWWKAPCSFSLKRGVDVPVIDDVIAAAGVSRGTFYNYFRTNAELLVAAIEELGNELVDMIESRVEASPSPAERLFTGFRLYLEAARRFPLFARFIARVGPQAIGPDNLVYKYIPIHIAQESKRVNSSTLR